MVVFVALAATCAAIFVLGDWRVLQPLFRYVSPLILVVVLPATLSGAGVLPRASATYDALRDYALPFALLLMVTITDVRALRRIGPRSLLVMFAGSAGVFVGAIAVFVLFRAGLPEDAWKMFAAITGSWIGGGANFAAVQSAVGMPPSLVGPAIVVDATLNYFWIGIVLLGVSYQHWISRWYVPDASFDAAESPDAQPTPARPTAPDFAAVLITLGVGLGGATLAMWAGRALFGIVDGRGGVLSAVLSDYSLGILCVTVLGIALSLTPLRRLEGMGAPALSYAAQFLFFASLGAQADFSAVLTMPLLILAGLIWLLIHAAVLVLGARLARAPMALIAVASIANVGGPSTAALVGAQYGNSWASLGVLLGLVGSLTGTVAGLACGAVLAAIAR